MKVVYGDMWEIQGTKVIPTNCVVKSNGELVMGAGVALQAKLKYPELPKDAGTLVSIGLALVYMEKYDLILFPTKNNYKDNSDISFIKSNLVTLKQFPTMYGLHKIVLPALGCGYGGLTLDEVVPVLHEYLSTDNFTLVLQN